jgi:hypothetical protein
MTDKDKFLGLLDEFGITPSSESSDGEVVLEAHQGRVDGYTGFICRWAFDPDGKFVNVGIWE